MLQVAVANKALLLNSLGFILLVRDAGVGDHANSGYAWDVPGGRMEPGETPMEGLVREIREEVGLEIDPRKARPLHVDLWGVGGDLDRQPIVGIFYVVPVGDVDISLSAEHTQFMWYDSRQRSPSPVKDSVCRAIERYRSQDGTVLASSEGIKGHEGYGLIQVFTGNGKGKTTAAIGEIVRCVGAGKRAAVIFFDKGGTHYSERNVLEKLGVEWFAYGRDRIDPVTGKFDFSLTDEDRRLGREGLTKARTLVESDQYDLLILDEINSSTDLGIVDEGEVLALIDQKPDHVELALTGRNAPPSFIERAHLVTEMRLRKHYFYSGVKAREGIDF